MYSDISNQFSFLHEQGGLSCIGNSVDDHESLRNLLFQKVTKVYSGLASCNLKISRKSHCPTMHRRKHSVEV
jgi:hypothetical protein